MSAPDTPDHLSAYTRVLLDAYKSTLGTTGHVRPADRRLARNLYSRGLPLQTVLDALLLATVRRYGRALPGTLPPTVRSLAYFVPIVEEVFQEPLLDGYRLYLAGKLDRSLPVLGITPR